MFNKDKQKEKKQERFIVKETHTIGLSGLSIVCDTVTGVHYLATADDGFNFSSITPLLDSDGNVVIEKNVPVQ